MSAKATFTMPPDAPAVEGSFYIIAAEKVGPKPEHDGRYKCHFYHDDKYLGTIVPKLEGKTLICDNLKDWVEGTDRITVTYENQYLGYSTPPIPLMEGDTISMTFK